MFIIILNIGAHSCHDQNRENNSDTGHKHAKGGKKRAELLNKTNQICPKLIHTHIQTHTYILEAKLKHAQR